MGAVSVFATSAGAASVASGVVAGASDWAVACAAVGVGALAIVATGVMVGVAGMGVGVVSVRPHAARSKTRSIEKVRG